MTYSLTTQEKPTYHHFIVTGQNSKENVMRYLEEIINKCEERHCFRALIEERLEGPRLKTMDVFTIVTNTVSRFSGKLRMIAYVDVNAEGDLMKFAENLAVNRMTPMKLFATVAEAEKWLLENE